MALVLADRVKETSTTTGTGTYTLAGAVSGFESFGSIGDGNTTYYACTLDDNFEVGIGTYTASGTTLARTTILQSSNNDNAVDWGAGAKTLFCTQPAEKAVFRDASGDVSVTGDFTLISTASLAGSDPKLNLYRNSASPADDDSLGKLVFKGNDSAAQETQYASIVSRLTDATNGTEDGTLELQTISGGSVATNVRVDATSTVGVRLLNGGEKNIRFDTGTAFDGNQIDLAPASASGARTVTLPDATGTVLTTGNSDTPATTTSSSDADFVLIDDGGTMKKIAPANLSVSVALDNITTGDAASTLATTTGNITIDAQGNDTDIIFKGTDNTSDITFLTMDGSESTLLLGEGVKIQSQQVGGTKRASLEFASVSGTSSMIIPNDNGTLIYKDNSDNVEIISTNTGATENPTLDLYRNSSSPAVDDVLGHIDFSGENDADEKIVYAKINADIADETDGTEDGRLDINVIDNGSNSARMTFQGNGHTLFTGRDVRLQAGINLVFEGATQNGTRTTLTVVDPSSARTVTFPDATGTVQLTDGSGASLTSLNASELSSGTVPNARLASSVLTTSNSDAPSTTTSSSDADFVLIDDGGTMKKITPSNLGIGSGGGGVTPATAYFDAFLDTNITVGSGSAVIAFDSIRQNVGSAFSLSSGEITISVAGTYCVMYQVTLGQSGTSSRTEGQTDLQKKAAGGSFANVDGTDARYYIRSSSQDETTGSASAILTISANDVLQVLADRATGSGSVIARAGRSRITIFRIA